MKLIKWKFFSSGGQRIAASVLMKEIKMPDNEYPDLSSNKRLMFHHFFEDKVFSMMRTKGIRGYSQLDKLLGKVIKVPFCAGPVIVRTNLGFCMLVDPFNEKGLEASIFTKGVYEPGTLYILKHVLHGGDIFLDIGANIGLMSLASSMAVGKKGQIYSFEPVSNTYDVLKYNVNLNKIQNINTYNIALGSKEESATIYQKLGMNRGCSSLIKKEGPSTEYSTTIQTLDKFIAQNNIGKIKAMKIDVEGWELEVLKGASNLLKREDAPVIILEYSNLHPVHNGQLIDIYNFISGINDYKIYKLEKGKEVISSLHKVNNPDQLPWHDNLFCFLPIYRKSVSSNIFL